MIIDITFNNDKTIRTNNLDKAMKVSNYYSSKGFRVLGFKCFGTKGEIYPSLEMYLEHLNKSV